MKFPRVSKNNPIELNLAPMIDVMLVLLVFFVMTTSFTQHQSAQLQVSLPAAQGKPPAISPTLVEVGISQQGEYRINGKKLVDQNPQTLHRAIAKLIEGQIEKNVSVIITADALSTHQSVVTVMDIIGQLGLTHLSITTLPSAEAH